MENKSSIQVRTFDGIDNIYTDLIFIKDKKKFKIFSEIFLRGSKCVSIR